MTLSSRWLRPRVLITLALAIFAVYLVFLHPWLMNWGTTPAEQSMSLPGDDLVAGPAVPFTRAVTINAPADQVWPWLLQIGQDRAGFYSNDWLENLAAASIHNSSELRPEWQSRALGDRVPMARKDYLRGMLGDFTYLKLTVLQPGRAIGPLPGMLVLQPIDDHTTRLLIREWIPTGYPSLTAQVEDTLFHWLFWDPMHFVMVHRMLLGIQARAEGLPEVFPPLMALAQFGWLAASVLVLALFLRRWQWWPWLLAPVALTIPIMLSTGDPNAALAGFLALGITILGALIFGRRWWPMYMLVAALVLLILVAAPHAYVAFGVIFAALILIGLVYAFTTGRRLVLRPGAPGVA